MKLFFKYVENIIENWLDRFFLYFGVLWEEQTRIEIKKLLVEIMDVFLILRYGKINYFLFSVKNVYKNESFNYLINKGIEMISMIFLLLIDIFGVLFIMFSNHILLAKKIFKDYVHDGYRREVLFSLMGILLVIISFSVLILI